MEYKAWMSEVTALKPQYRVPAKVVWKALYQEGMSVKQALYFAENYSKEAMAMKTRREQVSVKVRAKAPRRASALKRKPKPVSRKTEEEKMAARRARRMNRV